MEAFRNVMAGRKVSTASLLDFTPLSTYQKQYLSRVHALLAISVISTAGGVLFASHIMALPAFLGFLAQLGCVMYIGATAAEFRTGSYNLKDQKSLRRLSAFLGLAFFCGITLAPYIHYANYVHPSILPTALISTTVVFCSFSIAAMFATERQYLFLGGILSSIMMYLSLVSLGNIFFQSRLAHDVVLYGGLAAYMGYVLYDTQIVLYDLKRGVSDPVVRTKRFRIRQMHALAFYGDIIGIFVRLVQILIERERSRKGEEQRHSNRYRR